MPNSLFTHVGLCVLDIAKNRAFYEELFNYAPQNQMVIEGESLARLIRLPNPVKFHCIHLRKDNFELDTLQPVTPRALPLRERPVNELGLNCITFKVPVDKAPAIHAKLATLGGKLLPGGTFARDPNGQLLHLEPAPAGTPLTFTHVSAVVTDLEKSRKFYEDVLDFQVVAAQPPDGAELAKALDPKAPVTLRSTMLAKGSARLELLQFSSPPPTPRRAHPFNEPGLIHLAIRGIPPPALPSLFDNARAHGGSVLQETVTTVVDDRGVVGVQGASYIADPDGLNIYLSPLKVPDPTTVR